MVYRLIAVLLLMIGTLAACTPDETEAPPVFTGPALVMFYTDN